MARLSLIDAFTSEPFRGNPAAVVVLEKKATDEWMQKVAAEMNLSETAFLLKEEEAWRLRWFTPTVEIQLCGHATLAAAFALWRGGVTETKLEFETLSGRLTARKDGSWIELNFPTLPPKECPEPKGLREALGLTRAPLYVGRNAAPFFLVEMDEETALRNLQPDFSKLSEIEAKAVIVTSRAEKGCDFVSRFFGPRLGILEDPVTGAAHCMLGPYWKQKLGKSELLGYQASARGGFIRVRPETDRTYLSGQAVLISEGELV